MLSTTFCKKFGSPTWVRTRDNLINSQVLYQLSYQGIKCQSFLTVKSVTVPPVFLMPLFQTCSSLITRPPVKGDALSTHQFKFSV